MWSHHGRRGRALLLLLLIAAAAPARAEQTATYAITGPIGAALWSQDDETGAELVAYAFTHLTPLPPEDAEEQSPPEKLPPPGPRLVFSVTRWVEAANGDWVQLQWYGDAPLPDKALSILATLAEGTLDATVQGTLEVSSEDGGSLKRDVPGRLQLHWLATGNLANTTLASTYQTPPFTALLQTTGSGRAAKVTATLTVAALGDPIQITALGSLSSVKSGLLSTAMQ